MKDSSLPKEDVTAGHAGVLSDPLFPLIQVSLLSRVLRLCRVHVRYLDLRAALGPGILLCPLEPCLGPSVMSFLTERIFYRYLC